MAGLFSCFHGTQKRRNRQKIDTEMVISCVDDVLASIETQEVRSSQKIDTKMVIRWVDDALTCLSSKCPVFFKDVQLQLRFIKMFIWFFPQWDCDDENLHFIFTSIVTTTEYICKYNGSYFYLLNEAELKIREWKTELKNYSEHLISCSLKSDQFTRDEFVEFLDLIHANMNGLVAPSKSQIKELKERLFLLRNLIHFTLPMSGQQNAYFEFYVYDWANKAARLTTLHWLNVKQDEETREKLQSLHLDLFQKTPEFIRLCFGVIKVPKVSRSNTIIFGEFLSRFLDLFLENLVFTLKDDVPMLREGLIFLITFLADPPANAMDHRSDLFFFQKKIHAVLDRASRTISFFGETSMDLTRGKTNVVHLQKSIDEVRGKIEKLIPQPSWSNYNFPRTNGLGHFEFLLVYLENLKEAMNKNNKLVPFLKHQIFTIKEELMHLRPLLQDIWEIQNEHEEVKDLCEQITTLSYQSDLAIKSSFFIYHPIWYNLICLSSLVQKIKDIQSNVMKIKDVCRTKVVPPLMSSVVVFNEPTSTSIVEDVVGFKHETKVLINQLTRGTAKVDIVSIVGMGGIGKTTLAKKLYNESSIISHFHKRAFCTVSQEYRKRNVLQDILSDVCTIDDAVRQMSVDDVDDLAAILRKRLSGCKYLIVMDDIWDIDHWYDVRASFPENNNGSRIIFTTRISNISLIAKPDSSPYLLPFLSVDESWELLKQKIFHKDPCPRHLCELGKLIAKKCKRLPLTIVVIAGLLRRMKIHLSVWNEVADALTTFASSEGCKDVIRLSYKRLPERLKSCFLYLGAFREDEEIEAKTLADLWVAEGFVLKSGSSCCLRKVAKQYLNELGDRNLVNVTRRSCNGGITQFSVHDLIRDFCRTEAQEQHYWCFVNSHNSKVSMPSVCDQYRVCNEDEMRSFVDSKPRGPTAHSLLHFYSKDHCDEKSLESFLCNFKLVQVLDLRMVQIVGEFPTTITTLVQLRYLALQFVHTVKVPSEISNLWNLETLLLIGEFTVEFPCDIWKMKRLRHVEGGDESHVELDDVSGAVSQLPDLETFNSLVIPPGKDGEELLRRLPNVRKLRCLFSGGLCDQIPKLDILTNPESLQMWGCGRYVDTFNFPLTIRKLILKSFKLRWNEFTAVIRKLPTLQVLVLQLIRSLDDAKIWDVEDEEFPNIISLTMDNLDIEEWKASFDSFPCIKKLELIHCRHLTQVPPCFGEVPALESVLVRRCNKGVVDSALQIQKDQLDSGNNLEIL